jgi:hypothetical protein
MERCGEGGGGGVSVNEPEPLFQQGSIGPLGFVTGSTTIAARVGPDVSMLASPTTGVEVIDLSPNQFGVSGPQEVGGTSLASALFAGVVALGNQRRALPSANFPNGQPPIGDELNSAIYTINSFEPGRDFSLGTATGYTLTTGWGEPIVPNFTADLSLLNLNGSDVGSLPVNDYVNLDNVIFDATQYGDINVPISGSQLAFDSYTGTGTALSTGPTTFVISLNGVDDIGEDSAPVAISLTTTVTVDPATGQFNNLNTLDTIDAAKFVAIPVPLHPGQTLAIYFEGALSVGSDGTVNAIRGDFYAAIVDVNTGTIQKIGTNGINGSGDGDVVGNFEPK